MKPATSQALRALLGEVFEEAKPALRKRLRKQIHHGQKVMDTLDTVQAGVVGVAAILHHAKVLVADAVSPLIKKDE